MRKSKSLSPEEKKQYKLVHHCKPDVNGNIICACSTYEEVKPISEGWEKGHYPYSWNKHFYSKGSGYDTEPHYASGESAVDETLVEVKGTELIDFIRTEKEKSRREGIEEGKHMAYLEFLGSEKLDLTGTARNGKELSDNIRKYIKDLIKQHENAISKLKSQLKG